ncbi:signal peptidase I [Metabacillus fastidiosus]|uniref:signal peptidase I n=1 Tax=Metabacillus fastidiosus TaxID=1458 RepID=UPI003D28F307
MRKKIIAISFILLICIILFVKNMIFLEYKVEGVSMEPTYEEGNLLSINTMSHHILPIERFDVVVFHGPNKNDDYIKRVIGLPGDEISYNDDQLYINGKPVNEPYLTKEHVGMLTGDFTLEEKIGKEKIPDGYFFVIGDNRIKSYDSRHFGLIKIEDVVGKVTEN